jgi:hypothetical protein
MVYAEHVHVAAKDGFQEGCFFIIMADKLYSSEVTAIKKLKGTKLSAKEIQKLNKEIFDKSYFGLKKKEDEQRK